jgi:hypothetical protein
MGCLHIWVGIEACREQGLRICLARPIEDLLHHSLLDDRHVLA